MDWDDSGITLLNLDRSCDRLQHFMTVNAHLRNVERFSAIDGQAVSQEELRAQGALEGIPPYTPGALGVYLSHLAQWERAVTTGRIQTVAEDDAIFSHAFSTLQPHLVEVAGDDWDFILWGWNFDAFLWVDLIPNVSPAVIRTFQDRLRFGLSEFQEQQLEHSLFKLLHFFGLMCYSVSPRGARRMLDFCIPLRPMTIPFPGFDVVIENQGMDYMLNGIIPQMNAFVCLPPLVVSENRHETSTVQGS